MQSPAHEHRCYCGKVYQALASLQRHARNCPAASSEDCRHLLQLLACLEPQPVPGDLFYRTFYPFRLWDEDCNESVGQIFHFPSIFETERRLQTTIQDAINAGALHVTTTSSMVSSNGLWWACRYFTLPSPSQVFIRNDMASTQAIDGAGTMLDFMELQAIRVLLHIFPVADLDENFVEKGSVFFPFMGLLQRLPTDRLHPQEIPRAVDVCISASMFGESQNKEIMLLVAQRLSSQTPLLPLKISVQLRQMKLQLLNGHAIPSLVPPVSGRKGHIQSGEFLLLQSQQAIEESRLPRAWQLLQQWAPQDVAHPSGLEIVIRSQIDVMKGKVRRFQGYFELARQYLEPLVEENSPTRIQFSCRLHLAAVYTELGLWDRSEAILDATEAKTGRQVRLLQLSTAEYYLAQGLAGSANHLDLARELYTDLSEKYEALVPSSKATKRNFFRICFGLAIISHIKRPAKHRFSMIKALNNWQLAYRACREGVALAEGFPDLICLLSMAEIKISLSDQTSDADLQHALQIWCGIIRQKLDQRFFFTNLGTRWANLLCDWLEIAGKPCFLTRWAIEQGVE